MFVKDMELQRRLEYGFNGYQVPVVPRASRSARAKCANAIRRNGESNQIRAFEILASVAGKFLQENQNHIPINAACGEDLNHIFNINIKREREDAECSLKEDLQGKGSCIHDEFLLVQGNNSVSTTLATSKPCDQTQKMHFTESSSGVLGNSSRVGYFSEGKGLDFLERKDDKQSKGGCIEEGTTFTTSGLDSLVECDEKASLLDTENYLKVPLLQDNKNLGFSSGTLAVTKAVSKDDEENFVRCALPDWEDQIIKKIPTSQNCKIAADLKEENYNQNEELTLERSERMYPFKKRKIFNQGKSTSDGGFHCKDIFNSAENRCAAVEASSSITDQRVRPASENCNVKLSIKSFRVPELFIEMPESATIGSLKRTVMEAVTSILGDELHIGILIQGKKVQDDSKTLIQTGISQDDKRQRLGFMLEPRHSSISLTPCNENSSLLSTRLPQELTRKSSSLTLQRGTYHTSRGPSLIKSESCEGDLNVVLSKVDTSTDSAVSKCSAVVAVPAFNVGALAMVPFRPKSRNPEFVQRRIRRPFTVSEVEALVQAVEKLGTGRWRDVKLWAFDDAKHRTYVDLKDKWKTLVHTARIFPQQRRGEPVPQELLDRVLAAHAFWSQHQSKHQLRAL